jgi:hypothetical protein
MDDSSNLPVSQELVQCCAGRIDADGLVLCESKLVSQAATPLTASAPDQYADGSILCERTADTRTKKSVPSCD